MSICQNCKERESEHIHMGMQLCKPCTTRIDNSYDGLRDFMKDKHAFSKCTQLHFNGIPNSKPATGNRYVMGSDDE
jgi:hypothetical protein